MMKKIFTIFLALTMVVGLLAGCGKKNDAETGEADSDKLKVVTTIFPEYDWVKDILGDKAGSTDLTMLLSNGVDLHSYQPRRMTSSRFPTATSSFMWAVSLTAGWRAS